MLLLVLSLTILLTTATVSAADTNSDNISEDNIKKSSTSNVNSTINKINSQTTNNNTGIKEDKTGTDNTKKIKKDSKTGTIMTVTNIQTYPKSTVKLTSTVKTSNNNIISGGYVVFKINDKTIGQSRLTDSKAYFNYKTENLTPKNYKITVKYSGTGKYTQNNTTATLTVKKYETKITLPDKTIEIGNKAQLTATITDKKGNYLQTGEVAFKINNKTVSHVKIKNGKAQFTYDATKLTPETYTITATAGETKTTQKNTTTAKLTVTKIQTRMTVTNKNIWRTEKVQLTATVVNKKTGKYITNGKIVFKVNDKTITHTEIQNGKAYCNFDSSGLPNGIHNLSCEFSSSIYENAKADGKLNITILQLKYEQIKDAAVYLRNHYESDQLIKTVPIANTKISVYSFLPLMIFSLKNINNQKPDFMIDYVYYEGIGKHQDNIQGQTLKASQMLKIANQVLTHYGKYSSAPAYIGYNSQKFGFYNMLYSYSKMVDVSTTTYIPGSCKIYNWNSIHPAAGTSRTIYITSDIIRTESKDTQFMEEIKEILTDKGYTVKIVGVGPNKHNKIRDGSMPDNAVELAIFGGADAGVFNDMATRSFMRAKANRLMFLAFYPTAKDIRGLEWLERAHDDNYSPSSFKGLACPDKYLQEHGYDFIYSSNTQSIADALIEYIN